jgi:hypothetical protein
MNDSKQERETLELLLPGLDAALARISGTVIQVAAVVKAVDHAMTARKPRTRYPIGWDARL